MTITSGYRVVKMVLEFCLSLPVTGEVDFLFLDQCVGLLVTFATGWLVMHRGKALQEAFAYVQKQKTIEVLRFVSDTFDVQYACMGDQNKLKPLITYPI